MSISTGFNAIEMPALTKTPQMPPVQFNAVFISLIGFKPLVHANILSFVVTIASTLNLPLHVSAIK